VLAWLFMRRRRRQREKDPAFLADSEKYGSIVDPISTESNALNSSIVELDLDPGRTSMPSGPVAPIWTHEESLTLEHNASSFLESDPHFGRHGISVASDGYGGDQDTDRETMTSIGRDTQASASSDSLRGSLVALPQPLSTGVPRPPLPLPPPTAQQRAWLKTEMRKDKSPAIQPTPPPSQDDTARQTTKTRRAIVDARVVQAQAQELASAADALAAAEALGERASRRDRLKERVARATNAISSRLTKK